MRTEKKRTAGRAGRAGRWGAKVILADLLPAVRIPLSLVGIGAVYVRAVLGGSAHQRRKFVLEGATGRDRSEEMATGRIGSEKLLWTRTVGQKRGKNIEKSGETGRVGIIWVAYETVLFGRHSVSNQETSSNVTEGIPSK